MNIIPLSLSPYIYIYIYRERDEHKLTQNACAVYEFRNFQFRTYEEYILLDKDDTITILNTYAEFSL